MNGYEAALALLEKGVQCIPLNEYKTPVFSFKDISITYDFLFSKKYAYQNTVSMGILTRGLWCIDIDIGHNDGKNGFESLATIPFFDELDQNAKNTMVQTTPSGGIHMVFRKREGVNYQQKIGYLDGVDIKANDNNYFVMAGSRTTKGIYTRNDLPPKLYEGEFERRIFSEGATFRKQVELQYSVHRIMPDYSFSYRPITKGQGGLGKQAYQRIIEGSSENRNNDLYLAASYAKVCHVDIEPLKVLIGTAKDRDIFTENEFYKTVESAMKG
ncbi:DNA primase [Enterococcus villorum]|uniref:DNA primase n=1 Tax=Enterococcus villorum TaxID=112904 RepID=A0A1V8YEZ5_9ENTE|nr:bifunctional DNA primase/polymerase [Enterococcus villorum]OQO71173.1 DNA primase [Enterococcus villorum]OQO74997.1 DNA primase [Enterococcus villorum]